MPVCLLVVLVLAGCYPTLQVKMSDVSEDAEPDLDDDVIPGDPVEDPVEEEAEPPCDYPSGPYAFTAVGDVVGPMRWPTSIARPDDTGPADLEDLFCDPDVHSIFIQLVTITCPLCPGRMQDIALLRDHWETYGAKWIFIVADAATPAEADAYTEAQGVSFGWSTNDADNSLGAYSIVAAPIHGSTVPWTGVIRASDMQIVYEGTSPDVATIAEELASP
jgi:hypothetical protein